MRRFVALFSLYEENIAIVSIKSNKKLNAETVEFKMHTPLVGICGLYAGTNGVNDKTCNNFSSKFNILYCNICLIVI